MKRLLRILFFCLFVITLANSQTATVTRNVILRAKASKTSTKITTLTPDTELTLINPAPRNGFLHVQTEDNGKGWVWANNVAVSDEEDAGEGGTAPVENDVIAKMLAAHVDAVGQPLVIDGQTVCGPVGTAGSDDRKIALNTNKNRTDIPADTAYVKVDWADLRDLPANHSTDLPGAPVVLENVFLVHRVKPEGAESPNCGLTDPNEVDWHIYTSDTAGADDISKAVVVETTARTRPLHKWQQTGLSKFVNKNTPLRISGWLLYDYEHVPAIGTQRASVWEIHPITKIEVKQNGQWVDLDQ
jgi:Bacterial SH3 domain